MRRHILLIFCFSFAIMLNTAFGQNEDAEKQQTTGEIKISGLIEDDNGQPIPGANVLIKGTTIGTVTDINGEYQITCSSDPNLMLVFSYLGYITQEIKVKERSIINLVLLDDLVSLDEIVITGYQQIKSERATGSYGIMTEEKLENQVTANVVKKMEGAMSGVLVNDDNTFEIRGASTLFGNDQPLVVIDGVPVDTDLSNINPEDIEQITVLKDAASSAIYGVRSSNGVIVVTTKSAKRGEDLKVDFSAFFTIKSKQDLNDYQAASSASIIEAEMEAIQNFNPYSSTNINTYFYGYTKIYDIVDQLDKGLITQEDAVLALNQMRAFDHTQQFKDHFITNEFEQNYSLSLRGAGEKNKFYFSAGYVNNQSGYVGDKSSRLTLNLKDDFSPAKWIDLGINIYTTFNNRSDNSIESEYMRRKPYEPIVDENGNYVSQYKDWSMRAKDSLENLGYLNWDYNLIKDQQTRDYTTEGLNLRINGYAKFKITDYLSFTSSLYTEFDRSSIDNFNSQDSYYTTDLINRMTITDSSGNLIRQIPLGGISNTTDMWIDSYTFRNQLDFVKNLGKHHITAIGGVEMREQEYVATNKKRYGVDQQALQYVYINNPAEYFNTLVGFNGQPQLLDADSYFYDNYISELGRDVSYYANAGYRFERRYSVSGSFRLDQSNLFGVDKRLKSNPLWSVGALWNIVEEKFFTSDKINRLELKVSYGITGNVKKNLLTFATAAYQTNQYEEIFLNKLSAQNDGVGHEDTKILNIATQFAFFKWLSGSVEYFSKNSSNLLGQTPVDYTSGWLFAWSNYASSKSNGIELTFNFDAINTMDWHWRIGFNFTWVQTEVTKVNTLFDQATYYAPRYKPFPLEGYPVNSLFGFQSGGVDEEGNGIIINKEGEKFEAKDAATFKIDDLVYLGSVSPKYFGGIYTNLSYKNLTLDLLFTYKGGHVSRMPHPLYIDAYAVSTNTHQSLENRWRKPGDENIEGILPALRPSTSYYFNEDYGMYHTDTRVFKADHLRFRKVSLSYNLNIKSSGKPKSILFYGEVRNLALFTKNKLGIDPDYIDPYTGSLRLTEPMNFILGIRASF